MLTPLGHSLRARGNPPLDVHYLARVQVRHRVLRAHMHLLTLRVVHDGLLVVAALH